jgi:hypothetical protein
MEKTTSTKRTTAKMTFNERLEAVGINTIYPEGFNHDTITNWNVVDVRLEYQGKEIKRPKVCSVEMVVKREFGLII